MLRRAATGETNAMPYTLVIETAKLVSSIDGYLREEKRIDAVDNFVAVARAEAEADRLCAAGNAWVRIRVQPYGGRAFHTARRP